jgi:PPOX class probable F420-dependent enzyme
VTPARPRAHPVPGRLLPGERLLARLAARMTPRGLREIPDVARDPPPNALARVRRHSLLVTFRRDGAPVATPVWAAPAGGRVYVRSVRGSGKVRRLRRDPRALVAPCTPRGTPLGPPSEATARVLGAESEALAERALREHYGAGRALFEWLMDAMRVDMCYLEITPGTWS